MRPFLFAAALVFLAAPLAQAQVTFGVKGGLNTAFWTGSDSDGTDARLGLQAGLLARYGITPSFGLQAEALYSQKGVTTSENIPGLGSVDGTIELDYIEIPVLARVALPAAQFLNVGVMAGPSIGIPIRSRSTGTFGGATTSVDFDARTDIGAALGLDIGSGPFAVDLRYTFGLTKPINDDDFEVREPDVRNQNFNVSFVYLFGR